MAQAQTEAYSKYRVLQSAQRPAAEGQCLDRPSLSHPHGLKCWINEFMCSMLDLTQCGVVSPAGSSPSCRGSLTTTYSHSPITLKFISNSKQLLGHLNLTPWQAETFIWCCLFFVSFFPCLLSWEVGSCSLRLLLGVSPLSVLYELKGLALCVCVSESIGVCV